MKDTRTGLSARNAARWLLGGALACLLIVGAAPAVGASPPSGDDGAGAGTLARTDAGVIRGSRSGGVDSFLGIPYAQPPVGDLRWRPPQPVQPWRGVRDALAYGNRCP